MLKDIKNHLKAFSKNEKGQMLLLSGFIIVLGLITYTSLLNEMIFTTNTPQTGQDLSKNDIKQLRTLLVEQAQVASNYALYVNATGGGDVADTYVAFMNPLVNATSAYYVGHGASVDIELNSINNTNDTASLLPSTLFVRANMAPHTFSNQSIIIPMDYWQKNDSIMPVYGMIWNITHDFGIPVYQLLQDPRGEAWNLESLVGDPDTDFDKFIRTNDTAFDNSTYGNNISTWKDYAGGPYIIDYADLQVTNSSADNPDETVEDRLEGFNNGTYLLTIPGWQLDNPLELKFSTDPIPAGTDFNITFRMNDTSWKTVFINFSDNSTTNPTASANPSGGDAGYLQYNVDYTTIDQDKLKNIYLYNSNASRQIRLTNMTIEWTPSGGDVEKIEISNEEIWSGGVTSGTSISPLDEDWIFLPTVPNVTEAYITMHRVWEEFSYDKSAAIDRAPKIGLWPPNDVYSSALDVMTTYYQHSGVQYYELNSTVFDDTDYATKKGLYEYDIITIPHSNMSEAWDSDSAAIKKIVMWVKDGGVLHVECHGLESIDYAAQKAKDDLIGTSDLDASYNDWYGFIGVIFSNGDNTASVVEDTQMAFIGASTSNDTSWKYKYYNNSSVPKPNDPMADPGAAFNPLAQTYTSNGEMTITGGHTQAFIIIPDEPDPTEIDVYAPECQAEVPGSDVTKGSVCYPDIEMHNPTINIMSVPTNNNVDEINRSTYASAKFGNGTVIYLGSHNQAEAGPQRERLIFDTFFYAVLRQ
ncbi:MAG: hypothetical protein KAH86_03965, partial [Methanosarcinales archaeon]|nr:hypothetical protein [Methanosarcinales archaeon]